MHTYYALIIDDNANNIEVLRGLLSEQEFVCASVQDPRQAEAALERLDHIDVVFCDLEMPKINGFKLLPLLRQRLGNAVPIITYSVHHSEIDTARKAGFDGFLGKPLDADRFPGLLKRILNGQSVWELP